MYGTRDAAMNWQEEVARVMIKHGFRRGRYNPCLYYHRERNLKTFLHGDDFATVGDRMGVKWLKESLEKRFEIKTQCIGSAMAKSSEAVGAGTGPGPAPTTAHGEAMVEGAEGRLLNRIIRCTQKGWEIEPDQRHADLIIKDLNLEEAKAAKGGGYVPPSQRTGASGGLSSAAGKGYSGAMNEQLFPDMAIAATQPESKPKPSAAGRGGSSYGATQGLRQLSDLMNATKSGPGAGAAAAPRFTLIVETLDGSCGPQGRCNVGPVTAEPRRRLRRRAA